MGFEKVLDKEKDSVSRRLCFELLFLDTCNLKQILTMIIRIEILQKSNLVCSDINERHDIA